jgi:hypothetical protein
VAADRAVQLRVAAAVETSLRLDQGEVAAANLRRVLVGVVETFAL